MSDGPMPAEVRPARVTDASAAAAVVRRSIRELCRADHRHDPATLERWLGNKQSDVLAQWIAHPDNFTVVALRAGVLCGIGLLHASGTIRLMYLSPGVQRRGLGSALHHALEAHARATGHTRLHLDSTRDARAFYEALGYTPAGPAALLYGQLLVYPYAKPLRPAGPAGR